MNRLENPISLELIAYRTILFIVAGFDESMLGVFLIQCFITILSALIFVYQYVKYMPYFDNYVSITFGFLCFLLVWVVVNFALTYVIPLTGHFIVLLIGIIPVFLLVKNMRARFLEELLLKAPEKVATELEAITQCYAVYTLTMAHSDPEQEIRLIGLINVHLKECQKPECPLTSPGDLYDPCTDKHVNSGDTVNLHNNPIFLKHYAKMYFEAAISNFGNYPGVRIAYASFLFHAFRNVHAALNELSAAKKSKPNIMQSFEIYKFEYAFSPSSPVDKRCKLICRANLRRTENCTTTLHGCWSLNVSSKNAWPLCGRPVTRSWSSGGISSSRARWISMFWTRTARRYRDMQERQKGCG